VQFFVVPLLTNSSAVSSFIPSNPASSSPSPCQGAMDLGLVIQANYSDEHLPVEIRFPFTDLVKQWWSKGTVARAGP
jgi:hypothetical protein